MKVSILGPAEIEQALTSPPSVFDAPREVVDSAVLTKTLKIEILKRWELDARALSRATEENMSGGEPPPLDAVNDALTELEPEGGAPGAFDRIPSKL